MLRNHAPRILRDGFEEVAIAYRGLVQQLIDGGVRELLELSQSFLTEAAAVDVIRNFLEALAGEMREREGLQVIFRGAVHGVGRAYSGGSGPVPMKETPRRNKARTLFGLLAADLGKNFP